MANRGDVVAKQELAVADCPSPPVLNHSSAGQSVITISSSESSGDDNDVVNGVVGSDESFPGKRGAMFLDSCSSKKPKVGHDVPKFVLPVGFLDPLPPANALAMTALAAVNGDGGVSVQRNKDAGSKSYRQFWKAGDYERGHGADYESVSGGTDRLRVHPRFLHSNATSHKWALGAFAELLDNSLDEVCNGATHVKIDMLVNPKDGESKMLLVQDNGGGMTPEKMRQCMSLGYSAKSKIANTIGQYGNGFKTSTMRLGADVIVFSSCLGKDGSRPTKSVGILSYTFLRSTGKEDIIVPMIDFERRNREWTKIIRTSADDWFTNLDIIKQWSPYSSEEELLQQFQALDEQGTRIVIYNLWEDDVGHLELDFDADVHDIQIRGVNRDENKILLARQFPHSQHFLLYQHSLRNYASILYKRIPPGFRIILRGEDVVHHNLVNDMVHSMEQTYKPQLIGDTPLGGEDMVAVVTVGFVKDAEAHMDIQGFNVYHKNRLIKPFWRVWNAAGSDGRGVIGVLEANFVEPAHDKQGFERTIALSRLESKLVQIQKNYWRGNCHKIGYAPRRKNVGPLPKLSSHEPRGNGHSSTKTTNGVRSADGNGHASSNGTPRARSKPVTYAEEVSSSRDHSLEDEMRDEDQESPFNSNTRVKREMVSLSEPEGILKLKKENAELERRLLEVGGSNMADLQRDLTLERNRCRSLEVQLEQAKEKVMEMNKEKEALIQVFAEETDRRATEMESLRNRLQMASTTNQELLDKVKLLEKTRFSTCKIEK